MAASRPDNEGWSRPTTATSHVNNGSETNTVTVHHLRRSQSERIVWLCEELRDVVPEFTYELVIHERDPKTARAPSSLGELHPAGTAPILVDETRIPRQVIAESQAIVEYLVQVHGRGQHFNVMPWRSEYAEYLSWLSFANGTLQANLTKMGTIDLLIKGFKNMRTARSQENEALDPIKDLKSLAELFGERLGHHFDMIDDRLRSVRYLAGEMFTVADIMVVFSLTTMRGFYPFDLSKRVNILRYLQHITARPAYVRALQLAEPGMKPMVEPVVKIFDFAVFRG